MYCGVFNERERDYDTMSLSREWTKERKKGTEGMDRGQTMDTHLPAIGMKYYYYLSSVLCLHI